MDLRLLALAPLLCGTGCLIPVWRQTLLCPVGRIEIRDAQSAAPLPAVSVIVRRYNLGPPPRRESHRYRAVSDGSGRVEFPLQRGHEWVLPLMMHGVPQWAFDVCVEAPGYAGQLVSWLTEEPWPQAGDYEPRPPLTVTLQPGSGGCESLPAWQSVIVSEPASPAPSIAAQ